MKPIPKPRSWIVTALLAAAAVAYVVFAFLPGQRAIGGMRKQLHEKQEYIVQADRLGFAIQKTTGDLEAAHEYAAAWQTAAPSEAKLASTFGGITQRAQAAGLALHRFDPQPIIKLDSVWQAPINLVGEGDFQQVFEFIRQVETMPGTLWIQTMRLECDPKAEGRVRCEMTVTVFADNRDFSD